MPFPLPESNPEALGLDPRPLERLCATIERHIAEGHHPGAQVAVARHGKLALFRSFGNRRQIAAYAGLAPVPWQSGGIDRDQGIAKAGNPRLRKTMIQLAWLWIRHQPGSAISQWFARRVGTARGRVRRIAIVAVARKLLVALWRYVTQGVVPEGAVLKA